MTLRGRPALRALLALAAGLAVVPGGVPHRAGAVVARGREHTITVLAASSLTEVLPRVMAAYERRRPDTGVRASFAASSAIVQQVEQGAPADVVALADFETANTLRRAGLIEGQPRVFARNRLAIVVERGNPRGIRTLHDLARPGLVVARCADAVPCGSYARRALTKAGIDAHADSLEENVKAVVGRVALGEADAGIVYVTDARAASADVDAVPIPSRDNVVARYPVAVTADSGDVRRARDFATFLRGPVAATILTRAGFLTP